MRWGVLAPTFDPFQTGEFPVVGAARRAEELDFDSLWVGDHLLCPAAVLDSLTALAACSAVTTRIELGISVLQLGLRPLVWTAKQLMTLDTIAPARLRVGVGVGGEFEEEFVAAGVSRSRRGRRLDEMLEILVPLLRGEPVDHPLVTVPSPGLRPVMTSPPAITVGGRSEAALTRAAYHGDQWMPMWYAPETVEKMAGRVAELAEAAGRAAPTTGMVIIANVGNDRTTARGELAVMLDGQYRLPLEIVDQWSAYGLTEEVAEQIATYRDVGVREVVLVPGSANVVAQYEHFALVRQLVEGEGR